MDTITNIPISSLTYAKARKYWNDMDIKHGQAATITA